MSQQYSRWQDLQRQPGVATRSSRVEQVRLRIHEVVIDKLGSKLSDDDVDPDELLRLVTEQVHKALADDNVALSATERAQKNICFLTAPPDNAFSSTRAYIFS